MPYVCNTSSLAVIKYVSGITDIKANEVCKTKNNTIRIYSGISI
jgi:hypothetical protein